MDLDNPTIYGLETQVIELDFKQHVKGEKTVKYIMHKLLDHFYICLTFF